MNTVCLKILSMSIVLTVCSIDPCLACGDMSNAMRAIALISESESVNVENGDKSLECTYVIDLSKESAEEIAHIVSLADQINKQLKSNYKNQKKSFVQNICPLRLILSDRVDTDVTILFTADSFILSQWLKSEIQSRAGPLAVVG